MNGKCTDPWKLNPPPPPKSLGYVARMCVCVCVCGGGGLALLPWQCGKLPNRQIFLILVGVVGRRDQYKNTDCTIQQLYSPFQNEGSAFFAVCNRLAVVPSHCIAQMACTCDFGADDR